MTTRRVAVDGGAAHEVTVTRRATGATVWVDGRPAQVELRSAAAGALQADVDGTSAAVWTATSGDVVYVHAFGRAWEVQVTDPAEQSARTGAASDVASAPMPGVVVAVHVETGAHVAKGQQLLLIESMKMQTQIASPRDGVVDRVHVRLADQFERGAPLVSLHPEEGT